MLVSDFGSAQAVKTVAARAAASAKSQDYNTTKFGLKSDAQRLSRWLDLCALPLWATLGQAENGGFVERLNVQGRAVGEFRRARVQTRQLHVFAQAGRAGWAGPWRLALERGWSDLLQRWLRPDGLMRARLTVEGAPLDDSAWLYDQAFLVLAHASSFAAVGDSTHVERAVAVRDTLLAGNMKPLRLIEQGPQPFQSNPHMHLLEACLAWEERGDSGWKDLADRIVQLALERFVDTKSGALLEFFDHDWRPAPGASGRRVEPGHQFEWAWLFTRYSRARRRSDLEPVVRALYRAGREGVSDSGVAIDALDIDGRKIAPTARLWPQTEWLKAALILSEKAEAEDERVYLADARRAVAALGGYLLPEGLWRDLRRANGSYVQEASPASSFYHIAGGVAELERFSSVQVSQPAIAAEGTAPE